MKLVVGCPIQARFWLEWDFRRGFGLLLSLRLSATAARMRSFKAASSTLSPSWMSMARLTFPSRLELNRPEGALQRSSLGKCHLDEVLVRLSRADDAAVGPDRSPRRCRLGPLPLFDDPRLCLVDDGAHFRERLPAPVPKFFDLLVDECRGRFHRDGPFYVQFQLFYVQFQLSHLI